MYFLNVMNKGYIFYTRQDINNSLLFMWSSVCYLLWPWSFGVFFDFNVWPESYLITFKGRIYDSSHQAVKIFGFHFLGESIIFICKLMCQKVLACETYIKMYISIKPGFLVELEKNK